MKWKFTLIELIVVIAIIMNITGLFWPVFKKAKTISEFRKNSQPIKIEDNTYIKYKYLDHVYIQFENNKIHDPDCPKCLNRINGDFEK